MTPLQSYRHSRRGLLHLARWIISHGTTAPAWPHAASSASPQDPQPSCHPPATCSGIFHDLSPGHRAHTTTSSAGRPQSGAPRTRPGSLDPKEAAKFAALAAEWWDPQGAFGALHRFNPARCRFIRQAVRAARGEPADRLRPLAGLTALDVGCGGGILAESLARMGAQVHAIDVTEENVAAARQHALLDPAVSSQVRYECVPAEEVLARGDRYDLVLVSEVVEHVKRPDLFVKVVAQLLKDGLRQERGTTAGVATTAGGAEGTAEGVGASECGAPSRDSGDSDGSNGAGGEVSGSGSSGGSSLLIMSTLNRTFESFAVAIVGAEYVARAVPQGTHDWTRFITPQEMALMAEQAGLELRMLAGIGWSIGGLMELTDHTGINYIASFGRKASVGSS